MIYLYQFFFICLVVICFPFLALAALVKKDIFEGIGERLSVYSDDKKKRVEGFKSEADCVGKSVSGLVAKIWASI